MKKLFFLLLLLTYSDSFSQWINTSSPHFNEIAASGSTLFGVEENGVYISTNSGANWSRTSLNISGLLKIAAEGTNIFAGTAQQDNRGIYRSTNSGTNWIQVLMPAELYAITTIAVSGNDVYASTGVNFYHSTDNGASWIHTINTFFTYSLAISGNTIFAGAEATGVYSSTNHGTNWTQTSLGNHNVLSIKFNGTKIFAGADNGVYLSTNNGVNWLLTSLNNRYISSLEVAGENIFAGTDKGIYISKNSGADWQQKNEGLTGAILDGAHLRVSGDFIFASNEGSNTWRRMVSDIISIQQISEIIPVNFKLRQNYPNPFNPTTKINFTVSYRSFVSLKVYDVRGKIAADLISENINPGEYEYTFNGSSLPSGIYFYKLETTNFSETKTMVLQK